MAELYIRVSLMILIGVLENIRKVVGLFLQQNINAISWCTMKILG